MMIEQLRLSHIGWAVASVEKAAGAFAVLGFRPAGGVCFDKERCVDLLLLSDNSGNVIELVAPHGESSPVANLLEKNGPTPYHACFACDEGAWSNIRRTLGKEGFMMLQQPTAAPALGGCKAVFLYSRDIGLIEVVLSDKSGEKL